uniref:hypothetical protein n=1 Tax=Stappia sp. TaxID=1870903 RepID=UPI003BA85BDA
MTVLPSDFAAAMERLWTVKLGNVAGPAFRELWTRMGETFHLAIRQNMKASALSIAPAWQVLAPEMGVGKTQGALLYLAMMAKASRKSSPPLRIGGLFVARTIQQCEDAASTINELAGFEAAITRHSSNAVTLRECGRFPVVVITHAAVTQSWAQSYSGTVDTYGSWEGGRRCLVIIDEALANAIEFHSVDEGSLHRVLGLRVSAEFKAKHQQAFDAVSSMLDFFKAVSSRVEEISPIWSEQDPLSSRQVDELEILFRQLVSDLKSVSSYDPIWNDPDSKNAELQHVWVTLSAIIQLFRHWALFSIQGSRKALTTGKEKVPRFFAPVVLNATANQDPVLDYRRAKLVPLPKVRSYRNLTIHILRSDGIGKTAMRNAGEARLRHLAQFVSEHTKPGDKWMVVTHLATEALARKHLPEEIALTGHWGSLDGLNDFRDCNKAVLFGLSFRDPAWPVSMYFALRGAQTKEWLRSKEAKAIRHKLEVMSIAAQVIQALGRPRSRKVIDEEGNCLPTDVFVTLPNNSVGRDVESAIREAFTGAVIRDWVYDLDGPGCHSKQKASPSAAIVTAMKNKSPGRYLISAIAKEVGLSSTETANLKDALRKKRAIVDDLKRLGVSYSVEGSGRGAKSYLVKR